MYGMLVITSLSLSLVGARIFSVFAFYNRVTKTHIRVLVVVFVVVVFVVAVEAVSALCC